ncbi:hypothetical protein I204_06741 [Kwoniella mangroviensis CBS 8886]|nr:hypothetical protein I204_06741 [Kwoniella mangroviensis CBS 8886]
MFAASNTAPPYISQWEKYSSTLNLDTFRKLLPVHDNILMVLGQVIPATVIRLSKKHYNQIIPILYRHIKFDSFNTERFLRGWTLPGHPQEEIHWNNKQKEMMKHVKTISFLDEGSMIVFNRMIFAYHQLIKNDDILTNFFVQITHIQLGQQLVIASGRKWSEGDDSSTALAILLGSFYFYLNQYNVCFDVPEDTCAEERNNLSPHTIVTEEEHNRTCHIIAFWDGIHAIFEIVEGLRNEPQSYIFHWPNEGYTMMRGISNLITYRNHHFLNSPIILDLSEMEDEGGKRDDVLGKSTSLSFSLYSSVNTTGHSLASTSYSYSVLFLPPTTRISISGNNWITLEYIMITRCPALTLVYITQARISPIPSIPEPRIDNDTRTYLPPSFRIDNLDRLQLVHHLILQHYQNIDPLTLVRVSKSYYESIIPQLYRGF